MYVGGGIVNSGAADALLAFAEEFAVAGNADPDGPGRFSFGAPALLEHAWHARHLCRRIWPSPRAIF